VSRRAARAARRIRERFRASLNPPAFARALGELLASDVTFVVRRVTPADPASELDDGIHLATHDGAGRALIVPEPELVTAVLARLLGRPPRLTAPGATLGPEERGALAALAVEAARRSEARVPLRARGDGPPRDVPFIRIESTLFVDERPYDVSVWAAELATPTRGDADRDRPVEDLPDVPVELCVVAAISAGTALDVRTLVPGDVWFPGDGWLGPHDSNATQRLSRGLTRFALAAADGERGAAVDRSGDGRIVLRHGLVALSADASGGHGATGTMADPNDTVADVALNAPIVVRVEVGSVTLTARQWAELAPGDVIETGVRIGELAVLRVAGVEVARGELVDVEGELGVRVRELTGAGRKP
jgi:flagellar motor switch/type III secretory pathway protein FliN